MTFDFEKLYVLYPRHQGKKIGIERCKRLIKTEKAYSDLNIAINHYFDHCHERNLEVQYIMLFSTFMNQWEDWLDPQTGKSNMVKKEDRWREQSMKILGNK